MLQPDMIKACIIHAQTCAKNQSLLTSNTDPRIDAS